MNDFPEEEKRAFRIVYSLTEFRKVGYTDVVGLPTCRKLVDRDALLAAEEFPGKMELKHSTDSDYHKTSDQLGHEQHEPNSMFAYTVIDFGSGKWVHFPRACFPSYGCYEITSQDYGSEEESEAKAMIQLNGDLYRWNVVSCFGPLRGKEACMEMQRLCVGLTKPLRDTRS